MMGATGSEDTGQASGAAGPDRFVRPRRVPERQPLTGNEIRQLLTMTAEDVRSDNTGVDRRCRTRPRTGWDPHFGYGRVNLAAAMKRIANDDVPPEAQIDSPAWFAPINVDRIDAGGLDITGRIDSAHGTVGDWRDRVRLRAGRSRLRVRRDSGRQLRYGRRATASSETFRKTLIDSLAATCDERGDRRRRPTGGRAPRAPGPPTPIPDPDPERHAFQIRLTAEEDGNADNFGRYRKTLFAYEDDGNLTTSGPSRSARARTPTPTSPARAARSRRGCSTWTATTSST